MPQPVKKSSVTDIAIRLLITDLIARNQATLPEISKVFGYEDSSVISKFLRGERNYSRQKLRSAIDSLVTIYKANPTYLETGHGSMYAGDPYMNNDKNSFVNDPGNIALYANRQRILELETINKKLQERNKQLEELLKAKSEIIKLQKKIIDDNAWQPGTRG